MADRFATFEDERGTLLPVELDEVPFPVRRIFVVHGGSDGLPRGDHSVPCHELVVLLSGAARFLVTSGSAERSVDLAQRGDTVRLAPGDHVVYHLDGTAASVMVLASEPYVPGDVP